MIFLRLPHKVFPQQEQGIFSYTPEPHIAFCPIFVHPLSPVFEPHIQKWVIFVRRRPCVCDTFRFKSPPLRRKKIEFGKPRQLNFPNVKNDAGQKQYSPCEMATPSQEHGLCPPLDLQPPFLLNIAGLRGFESHTFSTKKCSKQLKNEVWTNMTLKVRRGSGRITQKGWTKMGQNVTWGSGV